MNLINERRGTDHLIFEPFFLSWLGTALVVLGPFAAAALIVLPAAHLSLERRPGGPVFGNRLELGRFQSLVLTLPLLTGTTFAGYVFVENYTPRLT
ncbi:MAG: hypothetical protein ACRDWS_12005 [Acidimicrobiia bacterium]